MRDDVDLDRRYTKLYGARAGFLPRSRAAVTDWNRDLKAAVEQRVNAAGEPPLGASVRALDHLMRDDGVVRMLVAEMIEEVPEDHRTVETIPDLLRQLDHITRIAPEWHAEKDKRNFFPMSALFTYMMMTTAGEACFRNRRFNDALRGVLRDWCAHLDSPESRDVLTGEPTGWLSPSSCRQNRLDEYVIPDRDAPHWGFASFNAFFHRAIRPDLRPVAGPEDDAVVVSPNDGTVYRLARDVALQAPFWIKEQPFSLRDMLASDTLAARFEGGDVLQSYLSGADYHRWHAPVSGRVVSADVVEGLMFSNLESEGNDIKGTGSQGYYTAVNTRGLCVIEADRPGIGLVCVMPVGITEISSIGFSVAPGEHVAKGQELGRFSYGGSSLAVVFQKDAIDGFTVSTPDDDETAETLQVNAAIAIAR